MSPVKEVQRNAPADIALPDAVKTAGERVTSEKVADGVWFIAGGSHNSVAIEMSDHIVLVEAPLSDRAQRAGARRGEEGDSGQADQVRDQLAQSLRPLRRAARSGR